MYELTGKTSRQVARWSASVGARSQRHAIGHRLRVRVHDGVLMRASCAGNVSGTCPGSVGVKLGAGDSTL